MYKIPSTSWILSVSCNFFPLRLTSSLSFLSCYSAFTNPSCAFIDHSIFLMLYHMLIINFSSFHFKYPFSIISSKWCTFYLRCSRNLSYSFEVQSFNFDKIDGDFSVEDEAAIQTWSYLKKFKKILISDWIKKYVRLPKISGNFKIVVSFRFLRNRIVTSLYCLKNYLHFSFGQTLNYSLH